MAWWILLVCFLQAIDTGSFLALSAAAHAVKMAGEYSEPETIRVCTSGYASGLFIAGLFALFIFRRFPRTLIPFLLIGGIITIISWSCLKIFLDPGTLSWELLALLEGGIGLGTSISYMTAMRILRFYSAKHLKAKVILMSLGVAFGGIFGFVIYLYFQNLDMLFLTVDLLSAISCISLIILAFQQRNQYYEFQLTLVPAPPEKRAYERLLLTAHLLGTSMMFGAIITFIIDGPHMLSHSTQLVHGTTVMGIFVTCNLLGRIISFLILQLPEQFYMILFLGTDVFLLTAYAVVYMVWKHTVIVSSLVLISMSFGFISGILVPTTRALYEIPEDLASGYSYFAMALGPALYGFISALLFDEYCFGYTCFQGYLLVGITTLGGVAILFAVLSWLHYREKSDEDLLYQ